jgi:hypothetical protein
VSHAREYTGEHGESGDGTRVHNLSFCDTNSPLHNVENGVGGVNLEKFFVILWLQVVKMGKQLIGLL